VTAAPAQLTLRELNRATLARQGMLERRSGGIAAAVKAFGAIQSQHPDWPPVALWTRLADFDVGTLERAFARRSIVRAGLMRMTQHVVAASDFWPMWALTQSFRLDQWRLIFKRDPSDKRLVRRLAPACAAAVAALDERPLRRDELTKVLAAHAPADLRDLPYRGLSRYFMAVQPLVQVPERGEVYGRGRYLTAEAWIGPPANGATDLATARAMLVRRHLAAFGPASLGDTISWVGRRGGIGAWRAAIDGMRDDLVELRSDDGRTLWDLAAAPRPDADTPAAPRFLARWDSLLLAHEPKRRTRILPAHHQARVFTKNADVLPTFLVDGMVAGTWSMTTAGAEARLVARPFEAIASAARAGLEAEAGRLARFMAPQAARHEVEIGVA
jgi:hypothetical protein